MPCWKCADASEPTRPGGEMCAACKEALWDAICRERAARRAARRDEDARVDAEHLAEAQAIDETLKLRREMDWQKDDVHRLAREGDARSRAK